MAKIMAFLILICLVLTPHPIVFANQAEFWSIPTTSSVKTYPPTEHCQLQPEAINSLPICVGSTASGGDSISIQIATKTFDEPVDIYFGLQIDNYSSDIFLLHPDNSFHSIKDSIAPWKTGIEAINKQLFSVMKNTDLPPGTYRLYLLITPQENLETYYLWVTTFIITPQIGHVKNGSIGYFDGTLVVPNAQILSGGTFYDEMVNLPTDTLVGIYKNNKGYLYHTGLGNTEISDETSRRAMGKFIYQDNSTLSPTTRSSAADKQLFVSESIKLETGVNLVRTEPLKIIAQNNTSRWTAIKSQYKPESGDQVTYLFPRSLASEINLLKEVASFLEDKLLDTTMPETLYHQHMKELKLDREDLYIESYGAVNINYFQYRAGIDPEKEKSIKIPVDVLENAFRGIVDEAYKYNGMVKTIAERYKKDPILSNNLDVIDKTTLTIRFWKALLALEPTEGLEVFINYIANKYQEFILKSNGNLEAATDFYFNTTQPDIVQNLSIAGINLGTAGITSVFFTGLDIIFLGNVILDLEQHESDMSQYLVFDKVFLPSDDKPLLSAKGFVEFFVSPAENIKTETDGSQHTGPGFISPATGFNATEWNIGAIYKQEDQLNFIGDVQKTTDRYGYVTNYISNLIISHDYLQASFSLTETFEEPGATHSTEFQVSGLPIENTDKKINNNEELLKLEKLVYSPPPTTTTKSVCDYIKVAKKTITYSNGATVVTEYKGDKCDDHSTLKLIIDLEDKN